MWTPAQLLHFTKITIKNHLFFFYLLVFECVLYRMHEVIITDRIHKVKWNVYVTFHLFKFIFKTIKTERKKLHTITFITIWSIIATIICQFYYQHNIHGIYEGFFFFSIVHFQKWKNVHIIFQLNSMHSVFKLVF